jgi:DNA-binding response OmpR family regulator
MSAFDVHEGWKLVYEQRPLLVLLDLSFNGSEEEIGLGLLKRIKADPNLSYIKVIVYSQFAQQGLDVWLRSLHAQADLVIDKKAVEPGMLEHALHAQIQHLSHPTMIRLPLDYHAKTDHLYINGELVDLRLTRQQRDLLAMLAQHAGQICTYDMLAMSAFRNGMASNEAVHKAIERLRTTLGDTVEPYRFIANAPGIGYRLIVHMSANVRS